MFYHSTYGTHHYVMCCQITYLLMFPLCCIMLCSVPSYGMKLDYSTWSTLFCIIWTCNDLLLCYIVLRYTTSHSLHSITFCGITMLHHTIMASCSNIFILNQCIAEYLVALSTCTSTMHSCTVSYCGLLPYRVFSYLVLSSLILSETILIYCNRLNTR